MSKLWIKALGILILSQTSLADSASQTSAPRCQFRGIPLTAVNEIVRAVSQQPTCDDAVRLAIDCSWYSSADVQINQPAFEICRNELERNNVSNEERSIFDQMNQACSKRFQDSLGTVDVSAESQCQLRALNWLVNLTTQNP